MGQREVDLPQLFSDVSRTVSGIKNILGVDPPLQADAGMGQAASTAQRSSGGLGSLFGGGDVCFKTCGMEDIQFAARSAGDMFNTLRICLLVSTVVLILCAVLLTLSAIYMTCRRNPPRRPVMPSCITDLFVKSDKSSKEELNSS
ncbi:unnamed protein product, partial [Mesorhabditis belari]|uniref:Uncharacterized protein n=1 Tax=Mesorhabditis belari TaxID=2138241 RepID=A0AAF3FAT8_9BILA